MDAKKADKFRQLFSVSIADGMSQLCGVLSHHLWSIEPLSAELRASGVEV